MGFKSNKNIKNAFEVYSYTSEEIEEIIKCKNDIIYFAEKYFYIVHPDHGKILFKPYDFQKKVLKSFQTNRKIIWNASRQIGKTTTTTCCLLWYAIFNNDVNIGILANKDKQAMEILRRIIIAYEMLPKFLKHGVLYLSRHEMHLDNDSRIITSATSSDALRGETLNCLYLDEFAFIRENIANEFLKSTLPTITTSNKSKIVITSTPNGLNHFYKYCIDAKKQKNNFIYFETKWFEVPERDEKWKRETLKDICNNDINVFKQEYECEFGLTVNNLISPQIITELEIKDPVKVLEYDIKGKKYYINLYEDYDPKYNYIITIDTAKFGNDYNSFSIIKIIEKNNKISKLRELNKNVFSNSNSKDLFFQIGVFNDNLISYLDMPELIYRVAEYFNFPYICIENNDVGQAVADSLWYDYDYDRIYCENSKEIGLRTTTKSKRLGCLKLKSLVESGDFIIVDFETIKQLSKFKKIGNSYKAETGHDDIVMSLVVFSYFVTTDFYNDLKEYDFKEYLNDNEEDIPVMINDEDDEDDFIKFLRK